MADNQMSVKSKVSCMKFVNLTFKPPAAPDSVLRIGRLGLQPVGPRQDPNRYSVGYISSSMENNNTFEARNNHVPTSDHESPPLESTPFSSVTFPVRYTDSRLSDHGSFPVNRCHSTPPQLSMYFNGRASHGSSSKTSYRPNSSHQYLTPYELKDSTINEANLHLGKPTRTSLLRARYRRRSTSTLLLQQGGTADKIDKRSEFAPSTAVSNLLCVLSAQDRGSLHGFLTGSRYNRHNYVDAIMPAKCKDHWYNRYSNSHSRSQLHRSMHGGDLDRHNIPIPPVTTPGWAKQFRLWQLRYTKLNLRFKPGTHRNLQALNEENEVPLELYTDNDTNSETSGESTISPPGIRSADPDPVDPSRSSSQNQRPASALRRQPPVIVVSSDMEFNHSLASRMDAIAQSRQESQELRFEQRPETSRPRSGISWTEAGASTSLGHSGRPRTTRHPGTRRQQGTSSPHSSDSLSIRPRSAQPPQRASPAWTVTNTSMATQKSDSAYDPPTIVLDEQLEILDIDDMATNESTPVCKCTDNVCNCQDDFVPGNDEDNRNPQGNFAADSDESTRREDNVFFVTERGSGDKIFSGDLIHENNNNEEEEEEESDGD